MDNGGNVSEKIEKKTMFQGLQQTLGEVLTISDAELDGLLDCGDEVIDQLSEFFIILTIFTALIII